MNIVDPVNINSILKEYNISPDIDLLSLDLDLTTHQVWEALSYITPKVLVIEYNGFFPKNTLWQANFKANESWDGSINMGASLSRIINISEDKNYKFIGTELSGTNAFFIHKSLENHFSDFLNDYSHEPARPYIVNGPRSCKRLNLLISAYRQLNPCYNHSGLVVKTLKSILNQTVEVNEIVVIDDHSRILHSDSILNLSPKIKLVINKTNKGRGYCRNLGVNVTTGNFILMVDATNFIEPDFIKKSIIHFSDSSQRSSIWCINIT